MLQKDNKIDLKVGDVIRFNRARKHHKIVNMFEYEGKTYFTYTPIEEYPSFHTTSKDALCGIYTFYGNVYDGVVEVNGYVVRGTGGKILSTPKPVQEKVKKDTTKKELTDFQKFFNVQCSGRINMTDIVTGSRLAGISEEKYEDILFHYDEYKEGKRQ
jgi:hypothetical protein